MIHQSGLSQIMQFSLACAIATTGPCITGNGGVFLSLCSMMSKARQTFLPSNFTSKEKFTNSALPLILFDDDAAAGAARFVAGAHLEVRVLHADRVAVALDLLRALAVSDDLAMFG